jgi:hypothetical protein
MKIDIEQQHDTGGPVLGITDLKPGDLFVFAGSPGHPRLVVHKPADQKDGTWYVVVADLGTGWGGVPYMAVPERVYKIEATLAYRVIK